MGRPRVSTEARVATAIRLPESLHRRLHAVADERDISANRIATRAIADYLDRLGDCELLGGSEPLGNGDPLGGSEPLGNGDPLGDEKVATR